MTIEDVNVLYFTGRTSLFSAAQRGDWEVVTLLLEKGADTNIVTSTRCAMGSFEDECDAFTQRIINPPELDGRVVDVWEDAVE